MDISLDVKGCDQSNHGLHNDWYAAKDHAASKGSGIRSKRLTFRKRPPRTRNATSFLVPPSSIKASAFLIIGRAFHCFGKFFNRCVCIPVFDAVTDTVFDMAFQYNLVGLIECRFCGIDLGQDVLAGNIFINHLDKT